MRRLVAGLGAALVVGVLALDACVGDTPINNTDAGDGGSSDAGGGCETGMSSCGSACVDLQTDPANCGTCGNACGASAGSCFDGFCGGARPLRVGAAGYAGYVVTASGSVWAWGLGESAQLGVDPTTLTTICTGFGLNSKCRPEPGRVSGVSKVTEISAHGATACVLEQDGSVWCWGNNSRGVLGHAEGTAGDIDCSGTACNPVPSRVQVPAADAISVGFRHVCVLAGADVYCWGWDRFGQASTVATDNVLATTAPVKVMSNAAGVSAGANYTCVALLDGTVQCWGANALSQLGHLHGTSGDQAPCGDAGGQACAPPTPVPNGVDGGPFDDTARVFAGGYGGTGGSTVTCALKNTGQALWCWGDNGGGLVGIDDTTNPTIDSPAAVTAIGPTLSVSSHYDHACAVAASHSVYCWGLTDFGELGNGTQGGDAGPCLTAASYHCAASPIAIPNFQATRVATGSDFTVALDAQLRVWGWGLNNQGQTGHAPNTQNDTIISVGSGSGPIALSPVQVVGLPTP